MTEKEIKLEARLIALEYLVCNLSAMIYRASSPDPVALHKERANKLRSHLASLTIPGLDPVLSDLASAELGEAMEGLLRTISEMLEALEGTT